MNCSTCIHCKYKSVYNNKHVATNIYNCENPESEKKGLEMTLTYYSGKPIDSRKTNSCDKYEAKIIKHIFHK